MFRIRTYSLGYTVVDDTEDTTEQTSMPPLRGIRRIADELNAIQALLLLLNRCNYNDSLQAF
jgi:hypothetical protein